MHRTRINNRGCYVRVIIVLAVSLIFTNLMSQNANQKPSRQSALDAFAKENYEQAYGEFMILLQNYTKDPLYKYYSGVCLVKLEREPENAIKLLQDAVNVSIQIKSVPSDVWFYLGRSQQMAGRFSEAVNSYNLFVSESGRKNVKDYNVSQYIAECNAGKGKLNGSEAAIADVAGKQPSPVTQAEEKLPVKETDIVTTVKPSSRRENLPEEYDRILTDGMKYQVRADSLNRLAAEYKKEYDKAPADRKTYYRGKITETESLAAEYQKLADEKLGTANPALVIRKDQEEIKPGTITQNKPVVVRDETEIKKDIGVEDTVIKDAGNNKSEEVFSLFEVITDPRQVSNQKIEIDPKLPLGLVYRIQIGVFSKPLDRSYFKGIAPVEGFSVAGKGMIRYYAGIFRRMADATRSLLTVKKLGFKDSFLVAISDGTLVSIERASLLEKEWGEKPLGVGVAGKVIGEPVESGPLTLSFRVEIARSPKPLKEEVTESYKKMAGTRGFENLYADDGSVVYLIGKFITFESAYEYADLLIRNGYREAKVVAYLGNREIPVDTAKQLFEKIE